MEAIERSFFTKVPAGDVIKPWIILGPFYKSYSDRVKTLSFFEMVNSDAGKDVIDEAVNETKKIFSSFPYEGQEGTFLGMKEWWTLVRKPEKYLAWGRYYFSNHLACTFLSTIITPERSGKRCFKLLTNARALVIINEDLIFDTISRPIKARGPVFEYQFEAELLNGENLLTIGLFRIGRSATVGFSLSCIDETLEACIPITKGLSSKTRYEIESEVNSIRLERDIFYPEHSIDILCDRVPGSETQLRIQLSSIYGDIVKEIDAGSNNRITICPASALSDGEYRIKCLWEGENGNPITKVEFDIAKITPTPALIGYEHLEERKHILLEHFSENPKYLRGEFWTPVGGYILGEYEKIWAQVAKYALERYEDIDEKIIIETCKYISERKDCSEFLLQAILRLMAWDQKNLKLNSEVRALMKDTVLGFRYWVDEPGESIMHMSSENHRILLHTAEWLAGELFPTEEFTNTHQRGLYHALKGRMYIVEWLRQRGRFGFDEWNSNCYYPINIAALVNIYDFAPEEEYKLRQMAKQVLDYMFFILAEDTFHGIFGTTHGRSYCPYIKYPDFEYTSSICWLLYGEGSLWGGSGMGAVSLATSKYKLPEIFSKIANDYTRIIESYQRQGFSLDPEPSANFLVYRTPDYMISTLQDYQKGISTPQTHVAQVTLDNKVVIFWSCPPTTSEGPGLRPDYWSGNITLPRAIQYRNVLALIWKQNQLSWMTHCFFEPAKFDAVVFERNWVFGQVRDGYVGIYSHKGVSLGKYGQYAGRELICDAPDNIWIVECGGKEEYGSFERFVDLLRASKIEERNNALVYLSPSIGEFIIGWDIEPTVNGTPVKLRDYPLINSIWAESEFGSGHIVIRYAQENLELWFD